MYEGIVDSLESLRALIATFDVTKNFLFALNSVNGVRYSTRFDARDYVRVACGLSHLPRLAASRDSRMNIFRNARTDGAWGSFAMHDPNDE